MNKQLQAITKMLLATELFSAAFNDAKKLARNLDNKLSGKQHLRLVYGETYDHYGMTIDSLKYYFILSLIHQAFEEVGFTVLSTIIVGDVASIKNQNVANKDELFDAAEERIRAIERIREIYSLPIVTEKMSDLFEQPNFQKKVVVTRDVIAHSKAAQELLQKTILQNRVKQEKSSGYAYAVEEIALILDYDIKIGPPREQFYDQLAIIVEEQTGHGAPVGLYGNPSYPFGMNFDYFIANAEIEQYGLTPYKAGSNKLADHRIILGVSNSNDVASLIRQSFVPKVPGLANPVQDLFDTALLAKHFLTGDSFTHSTLVDNDLKQQAIAAVSDYIREPLS